MAPSALSLDTVQNYYSDILEMNHLWDTVQRVDSIPSLFLFWFLSDLRTVSFVFWWWYYTAEPTEFHNVTLSQMFFVLLTFAWASGVISTALTPGHWLAVRPIERLKLDVNEMALHCSHGRWWLHTQVKQPNPWNNECYPFCIIIDNSNYSLLSLQKVGWHDG